MEQQREVALFIDFENIRYSVLNTYHREASGAMMMDIARRYGLVTLARAYADFAAHPERVQRDLMVAGISAVHAGAQATEDRSKSSADMEMLTDLFETLLDRPHLDTCILMTGDRRFIRIVNMIRNRYGKEVVIAGVRGSVSSDLIEAGGGGFEPLEFERVDDLDRRESFIRFVDRLERSKPYITFKYVAAAMTTSPEFPGLSEEESKNFVAQAIQDNLLIKHQRTDGYRVLHLNREEPAVVEFLGRSSPLGDEEEYYEDEEIEEGDEDDDFAEEDGEEHEVEDSYPDADLPAQPPTGRSYRP